MKFLATPPPGYKALDVQHRQWHASASAMASFLRGKQAGIQADLSSNVSAAQFGIDEAGISHTTARANSTSILGME